MRPSRPTPAKDNQRKTDEFVEAAQAINGPAGNPECVWLGRRVVRLMWLDDLDTAFRHLDLYDRFGCPGGHIQATFRCLTRFGGQIDPKVPETLNSRVHACWINPGAQPQAAAAATPAAPTTAGSRRAAPRCRGPRRPRRPLRRRPNNPARCRNDPKFSWFGLLRALKTPSASYELLNRVAEICFDLPLTWSDLGDGSASLPYWPRMV